MLLCCCRSTSPSYTCIYMKNCMSSSVSSITMDAESSSATAPLIMENTTVSRRRHPLRRRRSSISNSSDGAKLIVKEVEPANIIKHQRKKASSAAYYAPGPEYDEELPYGGLVYLARKKKPDGAFCIALQVVILLGAFGFAIAGYYHAELLHFHVTKLYAHLGHSHAQHVTAQRYLHGRGVEPNHTEAMKWFKKAADQGHPHASYNFAIGRMKGMHQDTQPGEVHQLIRHAASEGVEEAHDVLHHVCSKGKCDI